MLDLNSLLIGAAASGLCLSATMLSFWLANRGSRFMVTWSAGVVLLVTHVIAYWLYSQDNLPAWGVVANALQPVGAICLYAAARQFVDGVDPLPTILKLSIPYVIIVPPVFALGYDGVALIVQNAATAAAFSAGGATYFRKRRQAPYSLATLSVLYHVLAFSFVLCGVVLLWNAQWSIGYPPVNWAEELNVGVAILVTTVAGALTLSLDQILLARRHRDDSLTDPLTGLLNRRTLATVRSEPFGPRKALILLDLDHFKQVNDLHGHSAGDAVIRQFAAIAKGSARGRDQVVRLGGEEFLIVMDDVSPDQVRRTAEDIVAGFAATELDVGNGRTLRCTVSAGIAFGDTTQPSLDDVLGRADRALYAAKRDGRNRVELGEWRLVG